MSEYTLQEMMVELREFVNYAESIVPEPLPKLRAIIRNLETEQSRIDAAVEAEFERCCKVQCGDCEHGVAGYKDLYAGWCHKTSHGIVNCRANLLRERQGAKP